MLDMHPQNSMRQMNLTARMRGLPILRPFGFPRRKARFALLIEQCDLAEVDAIVAGQPQCELELVVLLDAAGSFPAAVTVADSRGERPVPVVTDCGVLKEKPELELVLYQKKYRDKACHDALSRLVRLGIEAVYVVRIPRIPPQWRIPFCYADWETRLSALHDMLDDEQSRWILAARIKALLTGNVGYLPISGHVKWRHPSVPTGSSDIACEAVADCMSTVDAMIERKSVPRLDFLKIDSRGAALEALKGAEKTLRAFRPNLAVSLDYSPSDLVAIPEYIAGLDLGYRLYMGHHSPSIVGAVLYASSR